MDKFIESIYLDELISQAKSAISAVARMNITLTGQGRTDEFFRDAQDLLQHAAAMSRILWPPAGKSGPKTTRAKNRGDHLRARLEINESHILKSRTLRDHLEHYDERLDDWAETS
jgi:hypothetical protein